MAATANTTDSTAINAALDQEFIANFQGEYDRLAEILGIFKPEVMHAGQTLEMIKITGTLNDAKNQDSSASSGAAYVEGDEVALSKYNVAKEPVGTVDVMPYRKRTTAQAILKSGYVPAVLGTDKKMLSHTRIATMNRFFEFLKTGTGTVDDKAVVTGVQSSLAYGEATLQDTLEDAGEATSDFAHFVNRQDTAAYLANASITTQTLYGMTYVEDFLGVKNVFITNQVEAGTTFTTPMENIHIFGLDFSSLDSAGLSYATQSDGLIGVAHTPAYDHVSVETHVLNGMLLFPENKDFIVKATLTKALDEMTVDELKAYAAAHSIDITGKTTKADILAAIKAAV